MEKQKRVGTNLILVGMMGCGKTTVGKLLADHLNWAFIDTDQMIMERTGLTIPVIFKEKGERYFRRLEQEVITGVSRWTRVVVATGGGAVIAQENRQVMKENGLVFYLRAVARVLAKRVGVEEGRPLLAGKKLIVELEKLLAAREGYYREAADVVLNTDDLNLEQVVEQVIKECRSRGILRE